MCQGHASSASSRCARSTDLAGSAGVGQHHAGKLSRAGVVQPGEGGAHGALAPDDG